MISAIIRNNGCPIHFFVNRPLDGPRGAAAPVFRKCRRNFSHGRIWGRMCTQLKLIMESILLKTMGNQNSRSIATISVSALCIIAAPVTGGLSVVIGVPLLAASGIGNAVLATSTHTANLNIDIPHSMMETRLARVEKFKCYLSGPIADSALRVTGVLTLTNFTKGVYHHYLIATTVDGDYIYVDKHGERNVIQRHNKYGMDKTGKWISGTLIRSCSEVGHRTVGDIVKFVTNYTDSEYHLANNNCQHHAQMVYNYLVPSADEADDL